MAKGQTHKDQHTVPSSYLKAWCDPTPPLEYSPFVWVFSREPTEPYRKSPEKLFTENNYYTIPDPSAPDGRNLQIEHALAKLEDSFVNVRDEFIVPRLSLTPRAQHDLLAFVAALQGRTPAILNHMKELWAKYLETAEKIAALHSSMGDKDAYQRKSVTLGLGPARSVNEIRAIIALSKPYVVYHSMTRLLPYFLSATAGTHPVQRLYLTVLCRETAPFFLTSDDPFVWSGPTMERRFYMMDTPYYAGDDGGEITVPLSPTRMLLMCDQPMPPYIDTSPEIANRLNRQTRTESGRNFVSNNSSHDPGCYVELSGPLVIAPNLTSG